MDSSKIAEAEHLADEGTRKLVDDVSVPPPKILVVDDLEANLVAMRKVLRKVDAEIHTATSGTEALSLLVNNQYAIALLDVQMPEMDGYELGELISGHQETRNTPIIFVTANNKEKEFISRGYQAGAVDYLCKPVDPEILLSKVHCFLDLYNEKIRNLTLINLLSKARARLETSNRELNEYAYLVSHDLQSPVRQINHAVEMIIRENEQPFTEFTEGKLLLVTRLCERMTDLIRATLAFAQIEHRELHKIPTDLGLLARQAKEMIEFDETTTAIEILDNLPQVQCDPTPMREVLLNLISNGIKYNDSEEKRLVIGWDESRNSFYVQDNGIGIPHEFQQEVFKMCRRLEQTSTNQSGTGVGLTLVRKIIDRHGGRVSIESEEGRGTHVYFSVGSNPSRGDEGRLN